MYIERDNFIELFKGLEKKGILDRVFYRFYEKEGNTISEDVLEELSDCIDLNVIASRQKLSKDFLDRHEDVIERSTLIKHQEHVPVDLVLFQDRDDPEMLKSDMLSILKNRHLPVDLYPKYEEYVDWDIAAKHQEMDDDTLYRYRDKLNWEYVSKYQNLSEDTIHKFKDLVDWYYISEKPYLTDEFVLSHSEYIIFTQLRGDNLSFEFLYQYQNLLLWNRIWRYHKFTLEEMKQLIPKRAKSTIAWNQIIKYQDLTDDFIREAIAKYNDKIDLITVILYYNGTESFVRSLDVDWDDLFTRDYGREKNAMRYSFMKIFYDKLTFNNFSLICEKLYEKDFYKKMIKIFKDHPDEVSWHFIFFKNDAFAEKKIRSVFGAELVRNNRRELVLWYLDTFSSDKEDDPHRLVVNYIKNNYYL